MLKNYLKIALRNLTKNKVYSFLNIGGLASGMAVAIMVGLWIWDELSFDKYHKNYEKVAQVMENQTYSGRVNTGKGVPIPLAGELRRTYGSDFKYVVLSSWSMNTLISAGEKKLNTQGNYMEADGPEMLSLRMLEGTYGGFRAPSSILVSESMAKELFGNANPLGKLVKLDNEISEKVAGVYEDLPVNSTLHDIAFIAPFMDLTSWVKGHENDWGDGSFQIFVQLADYADMPSVSSKIKYAKLRKVGKDNAKYNGELFLHPMSKWHLYSEFKDGQNIGGGIQYVRMFGLIGVFVLLLACINFMNLSTARSEKRAKEVGIRKAIGSLRSQLISQFFGESILMAAAAFILALLLVQLMLPFFNGVSGKPMSMFWFNPYFWMVAIAFVLITGLISGSYPALYLSSFNPVKVLKGSFKAGPLAAVPRRLLVLTQFTVSIVLIIGTIVVFRQVEYSMNRPVGYSRDGLITIVMQTFNFHNHFEVLRQDLLKSGAIAEMAESNTPVTENDHFDNGFKWTGMDPNVPEQFNVIGVTPEYGKTVGFQMLAGRDFSREFFTDSTGLVLNEAAVKYMRLKDPVGQTIFWYGKPFRVIGVAKDMVMGSPYLPVEQAIFYIDHTIGGILNIKINPSISAHEALTKIESICKIYSPEEPFNYKFADEVYAHKFDAEERIGKLAAFFASLAIFISCLGLFGMASFMAEQRIKEIGVRKVLGASVFNLWHLLSKEFVWLIIISLLIAGPLAYYFMNNWLQQYAYRSGISWWIFAAAGVGAILITLVTVSFQSIKAALMNPVKSLRTE
jgi:putative ABC transport system permease protein